MGNERVTGRGQSGALQPYSRAAAWAGLDGRSREARMLRDVRADLKRHVGGKPSATQSVLIERGAVLTVQLALMDAKHAGQGFTSLDTRQYLAWTNTLTRLMRQLGLKSTAERGPTLAEHIAARAAAS